uniref:Major facilitator superfamily (MFS) profile domain-containing protein n=1 Tax=Romanomermis culicivorax TaxID=13658 RepID=A0A915IUH9_ROMCU
MYLTEIAPVNYRGLLGSANQLVVTISILVANLLGFESCLGSDNLWPYLLAFTVLPSIWQLCLLPLCPESPKYLLINKGQHDNARNALVKLRQTSDVEAEINKMQDEADKIKAAPTVTFSDMFKDKLLRWALTLAVMMMLSQQLSGINATMFYSAQIFEQDAKLSLDDARLATIGVMLVNVLMTVVSTIIVDKAGRWTLQLAGLGGMLISTVFLVISLHLSGAGGADWAAYASIVFVIAFVVSFATGPGIFCLNFRAFHL